MDPDEEIIDEYFAYLADRDVYRAPTVLSWFTDYIDTQNENAIYKLLQHDLGSEAVAGLVDLLEFDDKRLTESVVHILGTIVEHPRCRQYVLEVPRNTATTGQNNPTLFTALVNMLMSGDKNVVMNAAGTIANIAESADGRLWILQQAAFDDALPILGVLTVDSHQWAASNSALVLARLTLSQEGIVKILTHGRSSYVLTNLCAALCGHNPGSSMNAAFAIGRLLEREDARSKLLAMKNFKNTMTAMTKMLYNKEAGPRKNACFAFSCLANSKEGHARLLGNVNSELILDQLVRLITDPDDETAWFAAVTLRSVCSQKEGVFRLRDHKSVYTVLKKLVKGGGVKLKSDLLTEVRMTLEILGKLTKLPAPMLTTIDSFSVSARWESIIATQGNRVTYQLYQGCTCVYEGTKTSTTVSNLKPFTSYVFRVRAINSSDEGPYSGPAIITTNEGVPGPPGEVENEGKPQHNSIKISWTSPPNPNGTLTGYNIYSNGERVAVVGMDKLQHTVRDLPHSTSVAIQVAGCTAAGEGEKSVPIKCSTLNLSDYPPKKPILSTSGGSNEINVSWIDPPKQLGPVDHYELVMNGEVIYSGKEQGYRVSNLEPLAAYTFNVRVVTADNYVIESEPAKKKAGSKDEEEAGNGEDGEWWSEAEKERLAREREEMVARLEEERNRLKELEARLQDEESRRKQEIDHSLTLGSRGGPAYNLDDPDVAGSLSASLLDKLRAAGVTDISQLDEQQILALNLTDDELNDLLDAIYMAKYLKASPRLAKFLKDISQNPLTLWKLNYQDVNNMDLSEKLKKELFGHVLDQQNSFVANLDIPTSRNIILKGWKDENLAFLPRHEAKLVTKDFQAKQELDNYIERLRAVINKSGSAISSNESEEELPEVQNDRDPTPEVAKPVSEEREIIRPKKKQDRFSTNKKSTNAGDKKSTTAAEKKSSRHSVQNGASKPGARQSLATIEEVSSTVTIDTTPPSSAAVPSGVSEVVVTRTRVPPNTRESSALPSTTSITQSGVSDPRTLAAQSLATILPPDKSVTFADKVRVNSAETAVLPDTSVPDNVSVYVPNVVTARVNAFDPEVVANTSDTAISVDNEMHKDSVGFLVNYVTSYQSKSEGGVLTSSCPVENTAMLQDDSELSGFAGKSYNHALSSLENSVQQMGQNSFSAQGHIAEQADDTTNESEPLSKSETKSPDTTSSSSMWSGSNQNIGITSLSTIASLGTPIHSDSSPSLQRTSPNRPISSDNFTNSDHPTCSDREMSSDQTIDSDHVINSGHEISSGQAISADREISSDNAICSDVTINLDNVIKLDNAISSDNVIRPDHAKDSDSTKSQRAEGGVMQPVSSLSDILLLESDHRTSRSYDMAADKQDDAQVQKPDYKSQHKRFNIDDVRRKETGVEEQNKLITALIAQQNTDLVQQNKRTKDLIDSVRKNMRNAIHSKRGGTNRQFSSNKFISAVSNARKNVTLSNVNMNMFGDLAELQPPQQPVNVMQVKNKSGQSRRNPRRKKAQLPPLERSGPITKDIKFHFPRL